MAFKAGAITGDAILNTSQWDRGIKKIDSSSTSITKKLGTLAKIGFGAAVAAMGVATFKTIAFEKEMRNVSTLIDNQPEQFEAMRQAILNMDAELGTSKDLASGLYQALSAGAKPGKEAIDVVTQSAKFATAALTDTNTAVDIITTAMNAYGKENINAAEASDLFFQTIKQGKITGQELSAVIGQSIPLFASTGIAMQELTAGMAAMTKQGIKASEATTQMNAIVNAFLKPSRDLSEALKDVGYESGAAFIEAEGLTGILEFLQKETKGEKSELAKLIPNIRGMKGAMALTGKGADLFTESLEAMKIATDSTSKAFQKQLDPVDTALKTFDKLAVIVGQAGKAFLDELAVAVTDTAKKMIEFFKNAETMETIKDMARDLAGAVIDLATFVKNLVTTIIDLPAPIKSAVVVGTALMLLIPKLTAGFVVLKTAIIALNTAAFLGPTGLIILAGAAVAALVTLGYQSYQNAKAEKKQREEAVRLNSAYSDVNEQAISMANNVKTIKQEFLDFNLAVTGGAPAVNMLEQLELQLVKVEKEIKNTKYQLGQSNLTQDETIKQQAEMVRSMDFTKGATKAYNDAIREGVDEETARTQALKGLQDKLKESVKARNILKTKILEIRQALITETDATDDNTESKVLSKEAIEANNEALQNIKDLRIEMMILLGQEDQAALESIEIERERALEKIQLNEDISESIKNDLILKTQEYYDLLKDKTAMDIHKENFKDLMGSLKLGVGTFFSFLENELQDQVITWDLVWKTIGAGMIEAIAAAISNQLAIMAAAEWAKALVTFGASIPGAIALTAASTTVRMLGKTLSREIMALAEGTNYHTGGMALVGEKGPEIVDLPTGSRVIPNDVTESMMSDYGKGMEINVNNPVVRQDSDINKIAMAVSQVLGRQLRTA